MFIEMTPPADIALLSPDLTDITESVILLPRRLTVLEAVKFDEQVEGFIKNLGDGIGKKGGGRQLKLDCHLTEVIDSSGIGALVRIHHCAKRHGIKVVLVELNATLKSVLTITNLDKVFTVQEPLQVEAVNLALSLSQVDNHKNLTHPSVHSDFKRVLDVVGAIVGLLITAICFLPIAIAIKLDSPGPIFFRQTRCGWLGKHFTMLKFRSMCADAEDRKSEIKNEAEGAIFKNKNDPRITSVGKFLRRTSLDELPQFWNVLMGDMSLVGTRPPTPDEVSKYDVPAWQRLDVKPGMTGEWQVNGRSSIISFNDIIELDLRYQNHWTLRHDIKLILQTILIVFNKDSGAH